MSSSAVRRVKDSNGGGGGAKATIVPPTKTSRSTTPLSERIICRGGDSVNMSTGKENVNSSRPTSRIRAAAKPQKPLVPPMVRADKDSGEPRARWSTSSSVRPRGRSQSPSEFNRVTTDIRKTRVSRVSVDRNERSVSVDRSARVSGRVSQPNKGSVKSSNTKPSSDNGVTNLKTSVSSLEKSGEICKESKPKPTVKSQTARVSTVSPKTGKQRENLSHPEISNTQSSSDSFVKVSESVKLFEKLKSKSSVGSKSSNLNENEENSVRSSFRDSGGKLSSRVSTSESSKEKTTSEDTLTARSNAKYPSKLHGKLAFLEEKVKRIASDIKRTKEMLDKNNPDASKVMLSDIQETVAGIEKAMGDVVNSETDKKCDTISNPQPIVTKTSPIKELSDSKSSSKALNPDELEARFFPHHKLLRDRTTRNNETLKSEVAVAITETKQDLLDSLSNGEFKESKVTIRGNLEICEVQETDSGTVNVKSRESFYSGKGNVDSMLTADETFEECDDQENKGIMIYEDEIDDGFNNQLNVIGHKTCTGGWFVSEGESVLLAHDDGSCTFYDVANSEEKSVYKAPNEISPNLWRDCWVLRAPGADGCSGRYVVAASAGNSPESGFCSWDFYTKEIKSLHLEDGITNPRTALAPLPNNVLNRRHDLTNMPPENRQWWYKPCGPLMISTASNQRVVRVFDIRDGEHVMKWEVGNLVAGMENSSPLQWRNRGKAVVAEAEAVGLWDVASLTAEPLVSVNLNGKKILGLHVNNTDAELGGGVRQRVSSSEAEGNDGVFCTSDSINVLDFRHPSGIGIKIPKPTATVHSIFSRGDSIYLGSTAPPSSTKKPPSTTAQIQHFSIRKQKLSATYHLPESTAHHHYKAITQVWGDSSLTMAVSGLGLFVFDALKDDGMRPLMGSDVKVRESVGPDNLYCPSFDYLGSRALVISRDRPAVWKYLA
ncbi:hypothetical protein L1887_18615 [Cichorium endivia]|nr:hypothetical protein L1887_18615 [Cichorium endivia]